MSVAGSKAPSRSAADAAPPNALAQPDNPYPLRGTTPEARAEMDTSEREGMSTRLWTYWMKRMQYEDEQKLAVNVEHVPRTYHERNLRASRKARADMHKAFADAPPSELSESDEELRRIKVEQDKELLQTQARRRAKQLELKRGREKSALKEEQQQGKR